MRPETLKGHLDGILLAVLEPGPCHGYAIMEALRVRSGGQVDLPTGTVYPALHRLERGLVKGSWSAAGGRRRRVYQLTRAGQACAGRRAQHLAGLLRRRHRPAAAAAAAVSSP